MRFRNANGEVRYAPAVFLRTRFGSGYVAAGATFDGRAWRVGLGNNQLGGGAGVYLPSGGSVLPMMAHQQTHSVPQNSLRSLSRSEISSMIDDIYKLFKDYSDCEGWVNKLLAEMTKSSGFSAGTIRDILENFRQNGTIFTDSSRSAIGSGSGSAGTQLTGYPTVSLGYGGKTENTAETLLHEIIHWAGMPARGSGYRDYYNDVAMANAWSNLGVVISVDDYRRKYPEAVAKYEADYEAAYGVKGMAYLESRLARAAGGVACLNQYNGLRKLP